MVSITSAHYRVGYIDTWVLTATESEQVFDLHQTVPRRSSAFRSDEINVRGVPQRTYAIACYVDPA